ncbi:unnamed protein product [Peniophora sp. CBMAI 1063]|nr:unnamed protein product [Peniophora sp. CBMAI 1063]
MFTWPVEISFGKLQHLRLTLSGSDSIADARAQLLPTSQQLVDVLLALESPKTIELNNIFPVQGSYAEEIALPTSLLQLVLSTSREDQASSCAQLWSRLIIPPNTNVAVDIRKVDEGQLAPLREAFTRPVSGFQRHPSELVIAKSSLLLLGSPSLEDPSATSPNTLIMQAITTLDVRELGDGPNAFFNLHPSSQETSSFLPLLDMHSVQVLHFTRGVLDCHDEKRYWLETFLLAQNVQRVVVPVTTSCMSLLYAVAQTSVTAPGSESCQLFPDLHTLTLHHTEERPAATPLPVFVNVLIYLIHVRRQCGQPIRALQISRSQQGLPVWDSVVNESLPITWF